MRASRLLALLALSVPTLAACGASGGGSQSSGPATPVAAHSSLPRPTALVLRAEDVGAGYLIEPDGTRRVTLRTELQHESARARAADRKAYVGGYAATYVWPGHAGVVSQALVYRDAASARTTSTDRVGLRHGIDDVHGHSIATPRSAPGTPRIVVAGSVKGLPLYMYGWQQGSVIELVAIFGKHATVVKLMRLARTQDLRLTHPTFGA